MISISKNKTVDVADGEVVSYIEMACLAADTKPTDGIATGSICVEVDTGNVYLYNAEGEAWVEQFCLQD